MAASKSARATARRRNGSQGCSVANRALELSSWCYRCGQASRKKCLIERPVAKKRHVDKSNAFDQHAKAARSRAQEIARCPTGEGKPALVPGDEEAPGMPPTGEDCLSPMSREPQLGAILSPNCNLGPPLQGRRRLGYLKPKSCLFVLAQNELAGVRTATSSNGRIKYTTSGQRRKVLYGRQKAFPD
jgi:hypothetical protein